MSVIVKGMEMPKCCSFCRCICGGGSYPTAWRCGLTDEIIDDYSIRDESCPLVELPEKHGRLIDAEKTLEFIKECIDEVETIIEAEGQE